MKLNRPLLVAGALALGVAGAATAGIVAHSSSARKTITVTEREYRITLSARKVPAGPVRFVVKDAGQLPHALEISGPGIRSKRTLLVHPGKSVVLLATLKAGRYTVWCPVPGHAQLGMKASLTATSTPTSTGGGGGGGGYGTTTDDTTTGPAWG